MSERWEQLKIQQYIDNGIEESLTLDYKAADALSKSDSKKKEITKDVSAMANSSGGIIIYGIREYSDPDKRHLAEKIDSIDRRLFSKEWLEHVINC
jgi:predicted HTH transcriptional regulator